MRWTTQAAACLVAIALAGCGPRDRTRDSGAETGAMTDTTGTAGLPSDTAQQRMPSDTAAQGMPSDTARTGDRTRTDTGQQNQSQSGVTDTSGKSTLGKDAQKTRPDQGQPVTSKGDTVNPGVDSAR